MKAKCLLIISLVLIAAGTGCRKKTEPVPRQAPADEASAEAAVAEPVLDKPVSERPVLAKPISERPAAPQGVADPNEYLAVFMEGKKVGHAIQTRLVAGERVTTSVQVSITISRDAIPITVNMTETSIETTDGEPVGFETIQLLGAVAMKTLGVIDANGSVNLTTESMGAKQSSTLEWPSGALMAEGLRLLEIEKGLAEGVEYSVKVFSPEAMQALDAHVRIGPKQNVDLLGRIVALTEVTTTMNVPLAGDIVSTSYVDDDLRMLKSVVPLAGMHIEMVACAKEFALGKNDVFEVIDMVFVKSPQPLDNLGSVSAITYTLVPVDGAELNIPSTDSQKVQVLDDGRVVVTVARIDAPAGATFPYEGKDSAILEALQPNRFLQSDNEEVVKLARRAVGDTKDAAEAAAKIEAFVADYIENKDLSVGYASAVEVAASRQGDCSEHAVLTAAMCRAVGIPAQVVTGIAYVEDWNGRQGFGGHAWVQVYIGQDSGKWVGLDAAFRGSGRGGFDPGHIAMAVGGGEPSDFFNLATTLGKFSIEKAVVTQGR